ncbi:polyprenyl synthetase family protein [Prevotellamassilia timonensis]|uniref:polyprenyl synthetase family protein n=1 Tax=Prevotellamassilia timonensis TaxID=1852370 RepID=UPI003FEE1909
MAQFAKHTSWVPYIEQALAAVPYPKKPEGLYEPIEYVLSMGGKRLRPTLLLMTYGLYKDDINHATPAAVGIETYHNHTLLHDDLMDHADMRRGKPTVHKKWNDNTAVLSGDTMLIMAFRHIMQCQCQHQAEALDLFAHTAQEICEGQQYDVNFETRTDVTEDEYIEMIRLKTSVLLACATKMGALLAGAPETDAEVLYRFAERVGLAFQLQDDYLDVYGDPAVFGKKIGGDILCGKKTYLLINAYQRADEATKAQLLTLIDNNSMEAEAKIKAVTDIYNALDIPALTRAAINRFYDEAHNELHNLSLPESQWSVLWNYATSLLGRNK